ncbi:MAG: hypothetical protein CK424_07090 [Legionella sp.]|nr:MAG: hypothetical protein CK424_07090 [Legionella sp.]
MKNNYLEQKLTRKKYSPQFKDQALERADKEGVPQVAKDLDLAESLLYSWRAQRKQGGNTLENQKLQQAELARLKRENTRLTEENAFLKKAAKKFKATTNSNHQLPVAPNLLQQHFFAYKPNEKWVSDITYCWIEEGWLYLAVVIDLYSRKVVGWAMSERMTKKLVIDALQMAIWGRKPPRGLIIYVLLLLYS